MYLKLIVDGLGVGVEMGLLAYFYGKILGRSRWARYQLISLYGVTGLILIAMATWIIEPSLRTLGCLMITFVPIVGYPKKWGIKMVAAFVFVAILAAGESLTKSLLFFVDGGVSGGDALYFYIRGVGISKLLAVILVKAILPFWQQRQGKIAPQLLAAFLMMPVATLIAIHQLMGANYALGERADYLVTAFATMLLIGVNIALFYFFNEQQEMERLKLEQESHKQQEALYSQMDQRIIEHRKLSHDLKNHLISLASYIQEDEKEAALAYIKDIQGRSDLNKIYYTGNAAVDGLFNTKQEQAKAQMIQLIYDLRVKSPILIEPMALVTVIANALDNALEATAKLTDSAQRQITCNLLVEESYLYLMVVNPMAKALPLSGGKLTTSKKDRANHGFGLSNIEETAEGYNGSLKITTADQVFTLSVIMQNSKKEDLG